MASVIVVLSVVVIALRLVNYGLFVIFLTPMFMLLSDYIRPSDGLILARVINESLGACLGLAASVLLWPDKETKGLPALGAAAIGANIAFACAVLRLQEGNGVDVDQLQRDAGVASARVEAARARLWLEGRERSARLEQLGDVAVALRSVCGAAAVLEITRSSTPDKVRASHYEEISRKVQALVNLSSPEEISNANADKDDDLGRSIQSLLGAVSHYVYASEGRLAER
jgi:hypothetical protein